MELFPPEICPLFVPDPAAAAAVRCTGAVLRGKIPLDLFKNTIFTEYHARWESPHYYAEIIVTVESDAYRFCGCSGIIGEVNITVSHDIARTSTPGDKYIVKLFQRFISEDDIGWYRFLYDPRLVILKLYKTSPGGGKLKIVDLIGKIDAAGDGAECLIWFTEKFEYQGKKYSIALGTLEQLEPMLDCEHAAFLYKRV